MPKTIRRNNVGTTVVIAKLLTDALIVNERVQDTKGFIATNDDFDAAFAAHITQWQKQHGLTPDGIIGSATWKKIAEAAPLCTTSKNRISGYALAVQLLLESSSLTADGVYGNNTKKAVATFQAAKGLAADGQCGKQTWSALICGAENKPHGFKQPVDYKQGDSRWGKKMYSNHNNKSQTMANSGCGPTATADVVATLKDPSVTPYTLAQLAMNWGDRTYSSGTAWSFFTHIQKKYGFSKMVQTTSLAALKACLDAGGYVVCSMGKGYWTKGGHYICAWKYDNTYIYCNDPASYTRKKQKQSDFVNQRKQFFCFYA